MEHIAHLPSALGDKTLDRVGQRVHAGCGGEGSGHGTHHLRVDNGDLGNVVRVNADELALLLHVGDDVVDRDLGSGAGGRGDGDGEHGVLLRRGDALKRADVRELRVIDDYADGLRGVHDRAAADRDDAVRPGVLERLNAVLNVFYGGIGLYVGVESPFNALFLHRVENLVYLAAFYNVLAGAHKSLLEASCRQLVCNFLYSACAVVGHGIKNDTICHDKAILSSVICCNIISMSTLWTRI